MITEHTPAHVPQTWYFTFGAGHKLGNESLGERFIALHGTSAEARNLMHELFGIRWSMQYRSAEDAGVERYSLREISRGDVVSRKNAGERVTSARSEAESE